MEIDVSECKFYEFDGICGSPINKKELECQKRTNEMCYYKQLQQVKAENKKAKKESAKYAQCFDEIEEICKTTIFDYPINKVKVILQKIKEVKENG